MAVVSAAGRGGGLPGQPELSRVDRAAGRPARGSSSRSSRSRCCRSPPCSRPQAGRTTGRPSAGPRRGRLMLLFQGIGARDPQFVADPLGTRLTALERGGPAAAGGSTKDVHGTWWAGSCPRRWPSSPNRGKGFSSSPGLSHRSSRSPGRATARRPGSRSMPVRRCSTRGQTWVLISSKTAVVMTQDAQDPGASRAAVEPDRTARTRAGRPSKPG